MFNPTSEDQNIENGVFQNAPFANAPLANAPLANGRFPNGDYSCLCAVSFIFFRILRWILQKPLWKNTIILGGKSYTIQWKQNRSYALWLACSRQRRRRKKSFWWWHGSFLLSFSGGGFSGFLCNHQEDRFTQGFLRNPRRLEHIKFISRNQIKLTSLGSFVAKPAARPAQYILHSGSLASPFVANY